MFVDELVCATLQNDAEIIEAYDMPFKFLPRGELYGHPDSLFSDLVEKLILHIDLTFCHEIAPQFFLVKTPPITNTLDVLNFQEIFHLSESFPLWTLSL